MSSYVGLYVQRLNSGVIHGVQVRDPGGNELSLSPDDYVNRGIRPLIDELPDIADFFKRGAP